MVSRKVPQKQGTSTQTEGAWRRGIGGERGRDGEKEKGWANSVSNSTPTLSSLERFTARGGLN